MIEIRNLSKTLVSGSREVQVLKGIDLKVEDREVVAIEGPSGSGKSTLLGLMAGFDFPTEGSIRLDGEEISRMDEDELAQLRGRKLGFVFQSYNLIATLTAEENVMLPIELRGDPEDASARARMLLDSVGLSERYAHYPAQLSGGGTAKGSAGTRICRQPFAAVCRRAHRKPGQRYRQIGYGPAAQAEPPRRCDADPRNARSRPQPPCGPRGPAPRRPYRRRGPSVEAGKRCSAGDTTMIAIPAGPPELHESAESQEDGL